MPSAVRCAGGKPGHCSLVASKYRADDQRMSNGTPFHSQVNQAQGMVSVQAACSLDEALVLMEDRATIQGRSLDEIAAAVVDRSIRFGE